MSESKQTTLAKRVDGRLCTYPPVSALRETLIMLAEAIDTLNDIQKSLCVDVRDQLLKLHKPK